MDTSHVQGLRHAARNKFVVFLCLVLFSAEAQACPKLPHACDSPISLYFSQLITVALVGLLFGFNLGRVSMVFIPYAALETKLWTVLRQVPDHLDLGGAGRLWLGPAEVALLLGLSGGTLLFALGFVRYFRRVESPPHVFLIPSFIILTGVTRAILL